MTINLRRSIFHGEHRTRGVKLPPSFHNTAALTPPFTANDRLCKQDNLAWKGNELSDKIFVIVISISPIIESNMTVCELYDLEKIA